MIRFLKNYKIIKFFYPTFFAVTLVCFPAACLLAGQIQQVYLPEADSLFKFAISEYEKENLQSSHETARFILSLPRNQRTSAASYLMCRITLDNGNIDGALSQIESFRKNFPESRYIPQVRMLLSEILYERGLRFSAMQEMLWVVVNGGEDELRSRAALNFARLFDPKIPAALYDELDRTYNNETVSILVTIKKAQLHIQEGRFDSAEELLVQIQNMIPFRELSSEVSDLREFLREENSGEKYIAVLFPFTGEYSEQGRRIYNGARAAMTQLNNHSAPSLQLKAIDTGGSTIKFSKLIKSIAGDRSILGILGPVKPDLQVLAGALSGIYEIPIILPGNNEMNTQEINDYLFQIKGSMVSEGAALANFAVNELGQSTFAILSPLGVPEEQMALSFALEVERLGGNVLASEVYYPGTIDYNQQFHQIWKIGYDLMMADSMNLFIRDFLVDSAAIVKDSLTVQNIDSISAAFADSLTLSELDSIWLVYLDALESKRRDEGIRQIDSLDYAVGTFDAFFIPIVKSDDLDFISNQFVVYNINTVLLGNNTWYDELVLDRVKNNIRNLYISSDYYIDDFYLPWTNFRDIFRQELGLSPGINELYGYDSIMLLGNAAKGAITRERLKENLLKISNIQGSTRGLFDMDKSHQKSNWLFLRYRRGEFELQIRRRNQPR